MGKQVKPEAGEPWKNGIGSRNPQEFFLLYSPLFLSRSSGLPLSGRRSHTISLRKVDRPTILEEARQPLPSESYALSRYTMPSYGPFEEWKNSTSRFDLSLAFACESLWSRAKRLALAVSVNRLVCIESAGTPLGGKTIERNLEIR